MSFVKSNFEKEFEKKRDHIIKSESLEKESLEEFFSYKALSLSHPNFCPLYKNNQKCHDMKYLNCLFCACPLYMVENSKTLCSINSRFAKKIGDIVDCSECLVPHRSGFVKKRVKKL